MWGLRIFLVFRDAIYANGLQATLSTATDVESIGQASSIASAWEDPALMEADVILLDGDLGGASAFIGEVAAESDTKVLICLHEATVGQVLEAVANGAGGTVIREQLTPDRLMAAVRAVAAGIHALDTRALRMLTASLTPLSLPGHAASNAHEFTAREQLVLSLVAGGLSNREIAERLSYSERTIKTVWHDIVTKLGVKSRSQAVAMAVRERMI